MHACMCNGLRYSKNSKNSKNSQDSKASLGNPKKLKKLKKTQKNSQILSSHILDLIPRNTSSFPLNSKPHQRCTRLFLLCSRKDARSQFLISPKTLISVSMRISAGQPCYWQNTRTTNVVLSGNKSTGSTGSSTFLNHLIFMILFRTNSLLLD
jgi:hypothetical protein